jgi:hypothetical protein
VIYIAVGSYALVNSFINRVARLKKRFWQGLFLTDCFKEGQNRGKIEDDRGAVRMHQRERVSIKNRKQSVRGQKHRNGFLSGLFTGVPEPSMISPPFFTDFRFLCGSTTILRSKEFSGLSHQHTRDIIFCCCINTKHSTEQ